MKQELIQAYERVRPILQKCGLSATTVAYNRKVIDVATDEQLKSTLRWIEAFETIHVAALKKAENVVSPEMWARYKAMHIEGLWEQENLESTKEALTKEWKSRPVLLKKGISIGKAKKELNPKPRKKTDSRRSRKSANPN